MLRHFGVRYASKASKGTFGEYMKKHQPTYTHKPSRLAPPIGYNQFALQHSRQVKDLERYLKNKYPKGTESEEIDLDGYNDQTFAELLHEYPKYANYIVYESLGVALDRQNDLGELLKAVTPKTSDESFKDILRSIKKLTPGKVDLPKMTTFQPEPTNRPMMHFSNLELGMDEDKLADFLSNAKKESDIVKKGLFKSQMNYEWAMQQNTIDPKLLESKNFFTPVLVPGTTIPYMWLRMVDYKYPGDQYLELFQGNTKRLDRIPNEIKSGDNIHRIVVELQRSDWYIAQIEQLEAKGWYLLDAGDETYLFTRNTRYHYWSRVKWTLIPLPLIAIAIAGTYYNS